MPHNDFTAFLKHLDDLILQTTLHMTSKTARRYLTYLLSMRARMSMQRYLERPKTYTNHQRAMENDLRMPKTPQEYKARLRVSPTEFNRLVDMIGNHPVFLHKKRRPQYPAKVQIAVTLNRLAHNACLAAIEREFSLPSKCFWEVLI